MARTKQMSISYIPAVENVYFRSPIKIRHHVCVFV